MTLYVFGHLGTPLTDCQASCLKLAPAEQAPCLNKCVADQAALEKTVKAGLSAGVGLGIALGFGVLGFLAGTWTTVAHPTEATCNRCDEMEKEWEKRARAR